MKHHVYEKRTKLNLYWSGEFTWGMTSRVIPVFHGGCVTWHKETAFSTTEGTVTLVYPYKKGIYTRNDFDITCCRGIQNSCQLWTWYRGLACGGPRSVVSDANYRASIGSSKVPIHLRVFKLCLCKAVGLTLFFFLISKVVYLNCWD